MDRQDAYTLALFVAEKSLAEGSIELEVLERLKDAYGGMIQNRQDYYRKDYEALCSKLEEKLGVTSGEQLEEQ